MTDAREYLTSIRKAEERLCALPPFRLAGLDYRKGFSVG